MRQVFSSPRLENVERVAKLLQEAGIATRVTHGRSYKGNWRQGFSYRDDTREGPIPAVWIVQSEDQPRARELLRDAGLLDSTRSQTSYSLPVFRSQDAETARSPARRRATLVKVALLAGIGLVVVLAFFRTAFDSRDPQLASPPFDGKIATTLQPVAQAVFAHEFAQADQPVLCFGVDGRDAPTTLIGRVAHAPRTSVPVSNCLRGTDSAHGSSYPKTGEPALFLEVRGFRPSAADAGTVEFSAFHDYSDGYTKTFAVKRIGEHWQVVDTLRYVQLQG